MGDHECTKISPGRRAPDGTYFSHGGIYCPGADKGDALEGAWEASRDASSETGFTLGFDTDLSSFPPKMTYYIGLESTETNVPEKKTF